MKNVYLYELKRCLLPFIVINTILVFIIYIIVCGFKTYEVNHIIDIPGFLLPLIIVFYIIYSFSFSKKINTAEFIYLLPVSKRKIFLGKYLFVLSELILTFILTISFSYLFILFNEIEINDASQKIAIDNSKSILLLYFLIQFIFSFAFLNVVLFFYFKATSYLDGIIYMSMALILPMLFVHTFSSIIFNFYKFSDQTIFFLNQPSFVFVVLDPVKLAYQTFNDIYIYNLVFYILYFVVSIVLLLLMIFKSKKLYGDNIERVDNSVFGYNLFIPFIALMISLDIALNSTVITFLIFFLVILMILGQYILFVIKNKRFLITKRDVLEIAITTLSGLIILLIF